MVGSWNSKISPYLPLGILLGFYFGEFLKGWMIVFMVILVISMLYFIIFRIKEVFEDN